MFQRVGRMFRGNKSDDESNTKRNRLNDDESSNSYLDNLDRMKVDDSSKIMQRIKQLLDDRLMSDVTLVVDGKEFNAHRLFLCSLSDVFQVMLMRPEWTEWHESRIILQEQQQCVTVFPMFLEYFYTGKITLTHDNVLPILALSDKYNVTSLSQTCRLYMCTNIAHAAANNQLISWLQYTLACGHTDVSKVCQNFIKWNFEIIAETEDFSNFDCDVLILLLQQNDIVISNEIRLYSCIVKWLDLQRDKLEQECVGKSEIEERMETLTEQVMLNIRFPMMSPRQLAELLLSPLVKKFKEFFVERMAIGMIYHSGQEDRISLMCLNEKSKLLFTPRLYTRDQCSSILQVDNFNCMTSYTTRTFMFSSHTSLAEYQDDGICEWVIDIYPKGVWFKKFYLIVWQGTVEVPEYILPTVRLAITCKTTLNNINIRVKIGILIYGIQYGIEHIIQVKERIHTFTDEEKILNIDDVIPFDELNPRTSLENTPRSSYLIGPERDILKIHLIITPLSEFSSYLLPNLVYQ